MEITIIGTGKMGRAIATRALAGGHDVTLIGSSIEKAQELASELEGSGSGTVRAGEEVRGDVVVLAVWYADVVGIVRDLADQLRGKVLVDITNPLDLDAFEPLEVEAGSAAQEVAAAAPDDAKVVKAFNTTFGNTLVGGEVAGQPLDVLIAGDDEAAKQKVSQLVSDGGLRPIDVGPLSRSQQLEHLGLLHISLQQPLGLGFSSAIKLLMP